MIRYLTVGIVLILIAGCFHIENRYSGMAPGPWRATIDITPLGEAGIVTEVGTKTYNLDDTQKNQLPFTFDLIYDNETDFHIEIINGEERIKVTDIQIGRNRENNKDTFLINFPIYESYIKGYYNERIIEGEWVVTTKRNYALPFVAKFGKNHRFTQLKQKPVMNLTGNWEVQFEDKDGAYAGVGEFKQEGNELRGTFRTETGDYRFLEGTVQNDKVYLSVFDGAHAFLFEAKILADKSMIGTFRAGRHYEASWTATQNTEATLADPNSLTYLKKGYDKLDFSFENINGETISLTDATYNGKAKLIQIFGTWCPNCKDESEFLVDYFKQNPTSDIAVIGLAFEKHRDIEKSKAALRRYKERLGMDYELLVAGYSDKKEAATALPMLNHILAYPTLIFLDKENKVKKIHTGFAGPATSKYKDFKVEFEKNIRDLIK